MSSDVTTQIKSKGELLRLIDQAVDENWQELSLEDLGLEELPVEIAKLTQLKKLSLRNNQLQELPPQIGQLENLEILLSESNQLHTLPSEIGALSSLTYLDLDYNHIHTLPSEIAQLSQLTTLDLDANNIRRFPIEITEITNLKKLFLCENKLSSLPPEISHLTQLNELMLSHNRLKDLPPEIGHLKELERLYIRRNMLKSLPSEVKQLKKLKRFVISGNMLYIPPEVIAWGGTRQEDGTPSDLINYYIDYIKDKDPQDLRQLSEAKLLLVGGGGVGKTSLINRFLNNDFNPHESKTDGLATYKWELNVNHKPVNLNIWDFGGQEIFHATHQFFLTKRSLYLLVCSCRETAEAQNIEYWLQLITSFGGKSPVIIVGNKNDEHSFDINISALRRKYPNIKAIVETSCFTGDGIEHLCKVIAQEVSQLHDIHNLLPKEWFKVKEQLEAMQQDFISYERYVMICEANNIVQTTAQEQLIRILHNLGAVLNYQNHEILCDTSVLNPHWLTQGLYSIFSDQQITKENQGLLWSHDLTRILDPKAYPQRQHKYLLALINEFQLGFELPDCEQKTFLLPGLLPNDEPSEIAAEEDTLDFQYHYKVLPASVILRFIVLSHNRIHSHTYWRTGVLLEYVEDDCVCNTARIYSDPIDRKIFISIGGQKHTRRDFLSVIRETFKRIHRSLANSDSITEWVPLRYQKVQPVDTESEPNSQKILCIEYQELLGLEKMNVREYPIGKLGVKVNVSQLLDGYTSRREHDDVHEKVQIINYYGDHHEFHPDSNGKAYIQKNEGGTNFQTDAKNSKLNQAQTIQATPTDNA